MVRYQQHKRLFGNCFGAKILRKISYDAMSTIFDDVGSFPTDLLDNGPGALSDSTAVFDRMFEV
eukprot:4258229-Ditylum_brightwellii.AAC.1